MHRKDAKSVKESVKIRVNPWLRQVSNLRESAKTCPELVEGSADKECFFFVPG